MGVEPKIGFLPPQIIHLFHRVFDCKPSILGVKSPYITIFGSTPTTGCSNNSTFSFMSAEDFLAIKLWGCGGGVARAITKLT